MIYKGDVMSNFSGSMKVKDIDMSKDVLLSHIQNLVQEHPETLKMALLSSGAKLSHNPTPIELIDSSVEEIYTNPSFQKNMAVLMLANKKDSYHNFSMDDFSKATKGATDATGATASGAMSGGAVGAVAGAIGSIFGTIGKFKEGKNQKEADKAKLRMAFIDMSKTKRNYTPIIIVSAVLLLGGVIAVIALRNK